MNVVFCQNPYIYLIDVPVKMKNKLFIHAVNIHQGGGRRLLLALLSSIENDQSCVLTVDQRMPLPNSLSKSIKVKSIKKSIISRLFAELWLYFYAKNGDSVLCFGNLPPLLPLRAFTSVFVQNKYLVDQAGLLLRLSIWLRFRLHMERWWLRFTIKHANQYLVQTPSMSFLMKALTKGKIPVIVAPFAEVSYATSLESKRVGNLHSTFIYVASGEGHKNHYRLIEAWCILASEGLRPRLFLTLDPMVFPKLCAWIECKIKTHNLSICNLGNIDFEVLADIYTRVDALIYPSDYESFGLPLIEASAVGLPILAAELDFVRDVVNPEQTFNPESARSIARAVNRFCGVEGRHVQVMAPDGFLAILSKK